MKTSVSGSIVATVALALAWSGARWGLLVWPSALLWLVVVGYLVGKKAWKPLALLVALSPGTVVSIVSAASFLHGTARLLTVGYPSTELYNVNPVSRLQTVSSGCIVDGSHMIWQVPNNITLRLLTKWMLMPGSYRGPYPSRDEAETALRTSSYVSASDLKTDSVRVGDHLVHLRRGLGEDLLEAIGAKRAAVRATVWKGSVLVLDLGTRIRFDEEQSTRPHVLAIMDTATGRVIAYYGARGLSSLPGQWK